MTCSFAAMMKEKSGRQHNEGLEMDDEILKKIQDAAFQVYEERAMDLLKKDEEYQRLSKQEEEYERRYQRILELLPKEDGAILADLSNFRDREAVLLNFWTFIAGVEVGMLLERLSDRDKRKE